MPRRSMEDAERRRAWIAKLVEDEVISTATEIHRRYQQEFDDERLNFSTIRKDIKKLGLILTPHSRGGNTKRYRLPKLVTGRDIEFELIHRFRVDVQTVNRAGLKVVVTTNRGVVQAILYLLKLAKDEEVIRGVEFVLSDNDDTIVLFCETEPVSRRLTAYLHKMLYAPQNTYSVQMPKLEESDGTADE